MFRQNLPENVQPNIGDDVEKLNNLIVQSLLQAADKSIPTIYKNDKHKHLKCLLSFIIQLIERQNRRLRLIIFQLKRIIIWILILFTMTVHHAI
jgi:hypothetical protein